MSDFIRGPWAQTADSHWSIDTDGSNTCTFIHDANDDPVAIVAVDHAFDRDDELDAKAALIATAPEMLTVLRIVAATVPHMGGSGMAAHSLMKRINEVIAKAEART